MNTMIKILKEQIIKIKKRKRSVKSLKNMCKKKFIFHIYTAS